MTRPEPLALGDRQAALTIGRCPDCGAEPTVWKGTVHRWRCRTCVAKVVGVAYRPSDPRPRGERCGPARRLANLSVRRSDHLEVAP